MNRKLFSNVGVYLFLAVFLFLYTSCKKEEEISTIELLSIENVSSTSATVVYRFRSNKETGSLNGVAICATTPNPTYSIESIRSGGVWIATMSSFDPDGTFTFWDEIPSEYSPEVLEPNTTYYVRAVLEYDNPSERKYSNQMTFTTLE